jgi:transposase-like protein
MFHHRPDVHEACTLFERARKTYVLTIEHCRRAEPPRVVPVEVTWNLFSCAALVMTAYCHPSNWPNGLSAPPAQHFPPHVAKITAEFARYLAVGKTPGPIADALRRGAPRTGPEERRDQAWAVAYVLAAQQKVISDRKPIATVAEAYGVEPRTVRRWRRELAMVGLGWQDMLPDAVGEASIARLLEERMREAGQRYLKYGRLATPRGERARTRSGEPNSS